jgi:hypothetical protein
MRTLVIGLALPNVKFDNSTFISAPSFSEYRRVIVDIAHVGKAVQEAVDGTSVQQTFGGQAVVNGDASAHAFPLSSLLEMRRRDAGMLLQGGGLAVLFGHPDASVTGVRGLEGWTNYSWVPEPEGFAFAAGIVPGFGREGAVLTDAGHPFAPYIHQLSGRIGYRAYANEDATAFREGGCVFARSGGGVAIGFELPVLNGSLVVLPALSKPDTDRQQIASAIVDCLDRWERRAAGDMPVALETGGT